MLFSSVFSPLLKKKRNWNVAGANACFVHLQDHWVTSVCPHMSVRPCISVRFDSSVLTRFLWWISRWSNHKLYYLADLLMTAAGGSLCTFCSHCMTSLKTLRHFTWRKKPCRPQRWEVCRNLCCVVNVFWVQGCESHLSVFVYDQMTAVVAKWHS